MRIHRDEIYSRSRSYRVSATKHALRIETSSWEKKYKSGTWNFATKDIAKKLHKKCLQFMNELKAAEAGRIESHQKAKEKTAAVKKEFEDIEHSVTDNGSSVSLKKGLIGLSTYDAKMYYIKSVKGTFTPAQARAILALVENYRAVNDKKEEK